MTPIRRGLIIAGLAFGTLGGCSRSAPIVQETSSDFVGRATLEQRADQIRIAGNAQRWRMETIRADLIRATYDLRSHQAVVDVAFDPNRFRLRYVASTNLNYDGDTIHRNYNYWIQTLMTAVVAESGRSAQR